MQRILTLLAVATLVLAACGGNGDADTGELGLLTAGTLLVCTDAPYEPFEFEEDGEWKGFDVEVVTAIADTLDLDVEWTVQPFDGIWLAPAAGTCDMVASAMTINEERAANALFSDPYYDADQSLLVMADSGIETLDDLDGLTLAVQTGTTGEQYANDNVADSVTIQSFDEPAAMFLALEGGDVDAILQDLPVNAERAQQNDSFALAASFPTGEQYGFASSQENTALIDAINDGLAEIKDNGTYQEIYDAWFNA